jgi:tetratricopeptide (TPR) repeat protein
MQRIIGPYYYGKRKWDNYLLDIQQTIESGNAANRQGARLQSEALEIAHEQVEELRQQTEQLRNIDQTLQSGLEELRAEFEWGFTLMVDRMDTQINLLSKVAAELDAIHQTLKSPLINQAQELFRLGEQHFNEGLLDRALKDFLDSEQKNEVHPLLQLQIGKLYLYGCSDTYNLVDLPQAERHLLLAARYADAKKKTLSKWSDLCGQAYFHAGVASYLIGEQEQTAGHPDSMRTCLERALGHLAKAAALWPRFTEILYTKAKCHALLGQIQDAEQNLEALSDRDRRYSAKAAQDDDFNAFRAGVEVLFKRATESPGPLARAASAKIDGATEALTWAKRSDPTAREDSAAIRSIERELLRAKQSLPTLEVDIEDLSEKLDRMKNELEEIAKRAFHNNLDAAEQGVTACERDKMNCERSIESLKQTMKQTSGTGLGWCGAILSFIVTSVVFFRPSSEEFLRQHENVPVIVLLIMGTVGAVIGSTLSRNLKNQPHKSKIEEQARSIDACLKKLPSLRKRVEICKQEITSFGAWRA